MLHQPWDTMGQLDRRSPPRRARSRALAVSLVLAGLTVPAACPSLAATLEHSPVSSSADGAAADSECPITPITMGQTKNAVLGENSCLSQKNSERFLLDRYRFTASTGQRIVIVTEARKRSFRPSVTLIREDDGRRVARAGPIGSVTRLPTGKWPLKLEAAGDYLVEVTSSTPDRSGRYALKLGQACGEAVDGARCDDGNRCTYDTCDLDSICVHPPKDNAPCDDGDACSVGDACSDGQCLPGQLAHCDDGNECTDDGCNATTGCVYTNNTGACDDGNPCTARDACANGRCRSGHRVQCDDGNLCTDDACDPATGCVHTSNTQPCEDRDACTFNDTCTDGHCVGGPPANCDDGNACTDDTCDPDSGCMYANNTSSCDDGNACTVDDACADGQCSSRRAADCDDGNPCTDDTCARTTGCAHRPNTAPCDDGSLCTRQDRCVDGECTGTRPVECEAQDGCHQAGICDPATGTCSSPPVTDGTACDDGNACTAGDVCADGRCAGGTPPDCDDGNPCTDDTCGPSTGCRHTSNTARCDDGNACTHDDTCTDGRCAGGPPLDCDDDNVCTDDTCEPATGCIHTRNTAACDDGDACTIGDTCRKGRCRGRRPPDCDDGNPCTDDGCDPASGCIHTANTARCDDGNACTVDDACADARCVGGGPAACEDANVCTDDTCEPATGCMYRPNRSACDDTDLCTRTDTCVDGRCTGLDAIECVAQDACHLAGVCDPASGTCSRPQVTNGSPCDDSDACTTTDTCTDGACRGTRLLACDDGNPCTDDSCNHATGCVHTINTERCDDGDACTSDDRCAGGRCLGGPPPDCDDANVCTDDACEPTSGCVHSANTGACTDGSACTVNDSCAEGHCRGGPPPNCDDDNACTDDTCEPASGCVRTPNAAACNDGDACTGDDTCSDGRCQGGAAIDCNDGNPCTDDTCSRTEGCVHVGNTARCDDGDACTTRDACADGRCSGGPAPSCDDDNPCTDDTCDPEVGCVRIYNDRPCDDGNACTTHDRCAEGQCTGDPPEHCNDGNPCTDDTCDPATGCVNTGNTASCNDGNACTSGDTCRGGRCAGGVPLDCDDRNDCTEDTCEPAGGCRNIPTTGSCEDGDLCTRNDTCVKGQCTGAEPVVCTALDPCHRAGTCDPDTGTCSNPAASDGTACNDSNACTTEDGCRDGRCVGGAPPRCDDDNPCTDDACDAPTGCVHSANTAPCDDGDLCTDGDRCADGRCVSTEIVTCTAIDGCHVAGRCDPRNGACSNPRATDGTSCDDGNACTTDDGCTDGRCTGGHPRSCDDDNPCTDDTCSALSGCIHSANAAPCDDGNLCTRQDTCAGGECVGGPPVTCAVRGQCLAAGECDPQTGACGSPPVANGTACNDGTACTTEDFCTDGYCVGGPVLDCADDNPCTDDACRAATGCVNSPNAAPCDDGNLCTRDDTCSGGRCTAGEPRDCDDGNPCTDDTCDPAVGCSHGRDSARCPPETRTADRPPPRPPDEPAVIAAAPPPQPAPRPVPATPVVAVVPPALQAPRALARGRVWKIQLAAVRSVAVAEDLIERFRDRYVDLVGNLSLGVERVDLGPRKGVYYRIQAGAFSDRASAAEVCEALSQRDVDCMVVSRN